MLWARRGPDAGHGKVSSVPALADTTIRLLGQEPLAGRMPTAEQLELAEILDKAGFAYLEVSGGGCFDAAVKRGVESPWERIRALKARTTTPLGLALRGRFLVGSRPVGHGLRAAFRRVGGRERHRRLPAPRSAERRLEPPRGRHGDRRRAARLRGGARLQPRPDRRDRHAHRARAAAAGARRRAGAAPRPDGIAPAAPRGGARRRAREASGLPVGIYCRAPAAPRSPRRSPPPARACELIALHDLPARAVAPPRLRRGARRGADGDRARPGRRRRDALEGIRPRRRAHRRRAGRAALAADRRPRGGARRSGEPRRRRRRNAARAGRRRPARRGPRGARPDPRRGRLAAARRADRPGARVAGAAQRARRRAAI